MQEGARQRILVLTPRDPYPTIGGDRLRIHRLATELSKRYELTLLTFCRSKKERDAPLPDDGVFREVHRVVLPPWRSWVNALAALPSRVPLQAAYYRSRAFQDAVSALAPRHDAVLVHLVRMARYARDLPGVRMLEMTDAISMSMARTASASADYLDFRRRLYGLEAKRLASYERKMAGRFDLVTLTSDVDSGFLFNGGAGAPRNLLIAPNGADIPTGTPPPLSARRRHEIAFVGNMRTLQNFDAAWFFAKHVLPRIRKHCPQAVFRVIGPIRPVAARRLGALSGVRIEGCVPRLDRALATTRIGVCPVRISAGVQNKVLDYCANRMAVVTSPVGLEGLEARVDEHVLLAETPDEWAMQVLHLMEDESSAQRLADAARELVRQRYSWESRALPLVAELDRLLQPRSHRSSAPERVASFA